MVKKALVGLWAVCVLFAPRANAAGTDVVLYASDATVLHGNWTRTADVSAAGGQMLASADKGASFNNPSPSPADYVEFTFTAPANTPHHLWARMRAAGNSKNNDSVYAQFSDARNSSGGAIYPIGTQLGLVLNLATDASGNSLNGWGWRDGAYWLTQTSTLTFAASGTHTLRIQTREDGVQIDQIVLSPATFLTTAPGPASNDTTIVPKASAVSTPYLSALSIPGTVAASDFDNGGEGVAYHDTTAGNNGGVYRST